MSKNIIYGLVDPRNNQLRYIGKTEIGQSRLLEHLKAKSLIKDTHKDRWLKQLLFNNLKPEFIVIEEFDDPNELFAAEEFWYEYFIGLGCNLTNSTKCGRGTRGYKHKEETIEKLKQKASKRDKTNYQNPHNKRNNVVVNDKLCRQCSKCEEIKEIEHYGWDESQHRFQSYCLDCKRTYNTKWHAEHPAELLPEDQYNASRLPGAKAGGEASKRPERRLQASVMRSKAIQGTHVDTGEIITFPSALKAKETGFQNSNIGQAIKYNKPYKDYRWTFI